MKLIIIVYIESDIKQPFNVVVCWSVDVHLSLY